MDAPSLTPERSRELADLRRRAYGPDADIHRDPDAVGRLAELEELARIDPADSAAGDEPLAADSEIPVDGAPPVMPDQHTEVDGSASPKPWWRRIPLWAPVLAAAAVGLAIGAVIALSLTPRADTSLQPLAEPELKIDGSLVRSFMDWLDIDDPMTEHEQFGNFRVLSGTSEFGSSCLVVVWPNMWADANCAPGELTPIVDYIAYRGGADPLAQALPPGSVIRFELRDGEVDVTVRLPDGE